MKAKHAEAMKLALEYVEYVPDDRYAVEHIDRDKLVTALREALAEQPAQQEPVAIAYFEKITGRIVPPDDTHRRKFPMCYRPLVFGDTSPQPAQHEPLTDDEIRAASLQAGMQEHYMGFHSGFIRFTRAIEAAHNIKEQP